MVHLQICEALDMCMGKDYQHEIITFERNKVKEIYKYVETSNHGCIRILHRRLMSFLKYMNKKDKGCFPLTYGDDIKPNMMEEELDYINKSYSLSLVNRFENNRER